MSNLPDKEKFLGFSPSKESKERLTMRRGIQQTIKERFTKKSSEELGLQIQISLLPYLSSTSSNKERRVITFVISLSNKGQQNLNEREEELPEYNRESAT